MTRNVTLGIGHAGLQMSLQEGEHLARGTPVPLLCSPSSLGDGWQNCIGRAARRRSKHNPFGPGHECRPRAAYHRSKSAHMALQFRGGLSKMADATSHSLTSFGANT